MKKFLELNFTNLIYCFGNNHFIWVVLFEEAKWSQFESPYFTLTLLSVVLPISLLVSFRLTGILQEPITETITLEAVEWSFQRPSDPEVSVDIHDTLESLYDGDAISANVSVLVWRYDGNFYADGTDCLTIIIKMKSTTSNPDAWIRSVHVAFRHYQASIIDFSETDLNFENLTLSDSAEGYVKAFVRLDGVNHPHKVHLSASVNWKLKSSESQSHQMEIIYEIIYYNGTAYKKVVQPFQLNIAGAAS